MADQSGSRDLYPLSPIHITVVCWWWAEKVAGDVGCCLLRLEAVALAEVSSLLFQVPYYFFELAWGSQRSVSCFPFL